MYVGPPPPPPREPRGFGSTGEHLTRCARGPEIYWSSLTKLLQFLPLGVLSPVGDILELNYSTNLFHQTVHALSARSCKTRQNITVLRGIHHSNKIGFSIAFFASFSAFFPHFCAFFCQFPRPHPPPPLEERHLRAINNHTVTTVLCLFRMKFLENANSQVGWILSLVGILNFRQAGSGAGCRKHFTP